MRAHTDHIRSPGQASTPGHEPRGGPDVSQATVICRSGQPAATHARANRQPQKRQPRVVQHSRDTGSPARTLDPARAAHND